MRREWLVCVLLAGLTLSVYWPTQNYGFIYYDDPQFIEENPQIKAGLTWSGIVYAFTQPVVGNWHPVTVLSHMLDCQLFGPNPGPHHLVSVGIHTLNALLLFMLLRSLTGATWRSVAVAAFFALHPLRVESVAWISERKDVLSTSFFLLTIWAWAQATRTTAEARLTAGQARTSSAASSTPNLWCLKFTPVGWRGLALVFYALGLMSKPMLVTLPFVLLLLDLWPLRRVPALSMKPWWPLIREKLPFFAMSAACSIVTLLVQREAGAMRFLHDLTWGDRLANAVESYLRYLGKLVWPTKLAVFYPHPAHGYFLNDGWPMWQSAAAALVLGLISVWCALRLARQPYLAVGWLWFIGTMIPVIGLVQVGEQAMANRYTYIPLIGPAMSLVWGLVDLAGAVFKRSATWPSSRPSAASVASTGTVVRSANKMAGLASAVAVLGTTALLWLTHAQLRHWRDTLSLFDYAIAVTPDNPSAQFALGSGLEKAGEIRWATVQYRVALGIEPNYSKANYNLGQIFAKRGDVSSAARHFQAALESSPDDLPSRLNFAHCLQRLGRAREAVSHYEEALRRNPGSVEALNNLAWLLATDSDPQLRNGGRAVELAERAVALSESKFPVMIGTLGAAYAEAGRFPEAVATAEKAVAAATAMSLPEVAGKNRELIELYRSQRAYHEPAR